MSQQERKEWISNLRVIATISVIVLHVASTALYKYNSEPHTTWWIGNVYDSLVRFSVPLFLMVTGALLVGRHENYSTFIQKKFVRILLPFIFWTSIYIAYNFIYPPQFSTRGVNQSDISWVFQQFREGSSYHLWYIYLLIGVYPLIPLLSKWVNFVFLKTVLRVLLVWFLIVITSSEDMSKTNFLWELRYILGYLGFVLLGYFISKIETKDRRITVIALLVFMITVGITAAGTFFGTAPTGEFYKYYYAYLTPNVILMAISVFVLIKNTTKSLKGVFLQLRNLIDKHSYGIYLVHVLVLNCLAMGEIDWYLFHPLVGIPLTVIICLSISTGIIYLIRKIPFGKYISG